MPESISQLSAMLYVWNSFEALKRYRDETQKLSCTTADMNADLLKRAEDCSKSIQLTAFESQLCRSLRKADEAEANKSYRKYLSM